MVKYTHTFQVHCAQGETGKNSRDLTSLVKLLPLAGHVCTIYVNLVLLHLQV